MGSSLGHTAESKVPVGLLGADANRSVEFQN